MKSKRPMIACLVLVLILLSIACGIEGTPNPTATPPVPQVGAILLLGNGEGNSRGIFEYKEGMPSPQLLWTLPGAALENNPELKPIIIPSPGHRYAMVVTSHTRFEIINLTNGETTDMDLPERKTSPEVYDIIGTFSPDERYLAYALTGQSATHPAMYLVDLSTFQVSTLFEGTCATYAHETIELVCGEVGRPVWLDETTIVFNAFAGDPPKTNIGSYISANRTFVTDVQRRLVQDSAEFDGLTDRIRIATPAGPTFLAKEYSTLPEWYVAVMLLAPDGQSVLRMVDHVWHLTSLSDGTDVELKKLWIGTNPTGTVCYPGVDITLYRIPWVVWSPDGKSLTCVNTSSTTSMYVFYMSDLPSRKIEWKDFYGYLVDWIP